MATTQDRIRRIEELVREFQERLDLSYKEYREKMRLLMPTDQSSQINAVEIPNDQ